jgi:hypothetical protein
LAQQVHSKTSAVSLWRGVALTTNNRSRKKVTYEKNDADVGNRGLGLRCFFEQQQGLGATG